MIDPYEESYKAHQAWREKNSGKGLDKDMLIEVLQEIGLIDENLEFRPGHEDVKPYFGGFVNAYKQSKNL